MTTGILLLAHGVIGLLALFTLFVRQPWRGRLLTGLCVVGAGFGIALVALNGSLEEWRTSELRGIAAVAGAAIATAWLVAAVLSAPAGRAVACALIGISSSALALAVTSGWVVPALLFWLCSSLAIAALAAEVRGGVWVWGVLFASDVALVAALLGHWSDTRSWVLPEVLDGWPFYVLLVAAALRAGAIPLSGAWSLLGRSAPAIPLLVGGAFCLLPIGLGEADPWAGVVLFVLGLAVAGVVLAARRPWGGVAAASAPPVAVMLGFAVIAPAGIAPAGIAAVVTAATAALWLASVEEGAPDRVVALVAVPPTVGFVAAASGIIAAVAHTVAADDVIDRVPWTIALVLGPLALIANVAIAARLAATLPEGRAWFGRARRGDRGALAVLVTRLILLLAVVAAFLPGDWLGTGAAVAAWEERRAILVGTAVVLGMAGAWLATRRAAPAQETVRTRGPAFKASPWLDAPASGSLGGRLLTGAALLLALGAIGAVGWFTFEGLRLGFL